MPWSDAYIEIPFRCDGRTMDGCDCWGLVRLIYKNELGIDLPSYDGALLDISVASARRVAMAIDYESKLWDKVDIPAMFDVVLFRRGNIPGHVGVVIDAEKMIHIEEGIYSVVEPYRGLLWKNKLMGFYRHAKRS